MFKDTESLQTRSKRNIYHLRCHFLKQISNHNNKNNITISKRSFITSVATCPNKYWAFSSPSLCRPLLQGSPGNNYKWPSLILRWSCSCLWHDSFSNDVQHVACQNIWYTLTLDQYNSATFLLVKGSIPEGAQKAHKYTCFARSAEGTNVWFA